ncbi:MAG: 23S rRNA (guanosine(2251)-2'-O)-methyltransferase RlmB [Bacilli bacterium]|nr:23S rRNA (guanosine(2251)-2'-O)-methyltransferase RlmB [Bacilli bacterium]
MLVYGKNVCELILEKGLDISNIYLQDNFDDKKILYLIEKNDLRYKSLSKIKMNDLCEGVHQGIIMDVPGYKYSSIDEVLGSNKFVVILDHLEDPHNLGAIIRTCEAAGVDAIIIPSNRSVEVNGTVVKTSAGTCYQMNIIKVVNIVETIKYLKDNGYWIVGTSLDTDTDYREVDYSGNIALVIGNEGKGVADLVLKNCDYVTKIPMYGETNSLNASVAAGIMIYEVIRNRK